ncbi:MAG: hypothetical protein WBQ20_02470 [Methyloceanibacter sp.]
MKTVSQLYILDEYATLRQAALLRVLCLSLIQEVYNHWKISHLWFLLLARAAQRKDASSLDEHLAQPSGKRVSSTISRATKHKKKEKVPFPWVKDLKPNLEKSVNVVKSDAEWWKTLTPEEFRVTREQRCSVIAITKRSARECITVSVAALHCSAPGPNMIRALAGQAFMPQQ